MKKITGMIACVLIGLMLFGFYPEAPCSHEAEHSVLHAATCYHTFNGSYVTIKTPTCTTSGTKVGYCTKCGEVVSTVTIPALGHSYGSWITLQAATCTTSGYKKRTCTRCSVFETQTIPATGHTFNGSYTTTKEPTCTTSGTKVGKCTKCGAVVSTVTIPALGHSYGSWITIHAATCAETGTKKRTCTRSGCSAYETGTIPKLDHTFNGSYETTVPATCETAGTMVGKCTKCGGIVSTATIPALGHSYGSWITIQEETCTGSGVQKRTCTRSGCSDYETQTISATGHTFNGSYTTSIEPTCTTSGTKVGYCMKCGVVLSTVTIDPLGHSYGSWINLQEATCTGSGIQKRTCTRSGCSDYETQTISATGHTFNGSYTTSIEPTCTTSGTKVGYCTKCGVVLSTVTLDPLGHSYGPWKVTLEPTCTEPGIETQTCTRSGCSAYQNQPIPELGGDHSFNGSYTTTLEPTCTTSGTKVGYCTRCGVVLSTFTIPPLGHLWGPWEVTEPGIEKRICTRSGCSADEKVFTPTSTDSFEVGTGSYPYLWTPQSLNPALMTWETSGGRNNSRCVSIFSTTPNDAMWKRSFHLTPNQYYIGRVYVKGQNIGYRGANICVAGTWVRSDGYLGAFDWKEINFNFKAPSSGVVEIGCRLGYSNDLATGKVWFDDLQIEPMNMSVTSGSNVSVSLEPGDLTGINPASMTRWVNHLDAAYNAYYDLVGRAPFSGAQQEVLSVRGDPGGWAVSGNPILWHKPNISGELKSINDNDDWSFGILHEIGHNYDLDGWNWDGEFWANTKMYFVVEALNGKVKLAGNYCSASGLRQYYFSVAEGSYLNTIGNITNRTYHHDALTFCMIRIRERIGWGPFQQTFRHFLSSGENPATKLDKFNRFLQLLQEYYHPGGYEVENTFLMGELELIRARINLD